jgi:hypothetical protein
MAKLREVALWLWDKEPGLDAGEILLSSNAGLMWVVSCTGPTVHPIHQQDLTDLL